MRRTLSLIPAAAAVLALAAPLFAGGFWLVLGNPEASAEARAMKAVLTVKSAGCLTPATTDVSGTAIGIVNGERQSIPLKLVRLSEPGFFALKQQWPATGRWVIQLVGANHGAVTHALVAAGPDGVDRMSAKLAIGQPRAEEVEAFLRAGAAPAAIARK